jgi:DNA-binding IscR family transcriptional regulator
VGGGYRLARPTSRITVLDVVTVFEPPRAPGDCLLRAAPGDESPGADGCSLQDLFDEIDEMVRCTFASVTLETLVRRGRRPQPVPLERRRA